MNIKLTNHSTNLTDEEYELIQNNSFNGIEITSKKKDYVGYNPTITVSSSSVDIVSDFAENNAGIGNITCSIDLNSFSTYFDISIDPDEDSEDEIKDILKKHNWTITSKTSKSDDDYDDDIEDLSSFGVDDIEEALIPKRKKKKHYTKNSLKGFLDYFPDYDVDTLNHSLGADTNCDGGECSGDSCGGE